MIGENAGNNFDKGNENTIIGYKSGPTGSNISIIRNTIVGPSAGLHFVDGSTSNIAIGDSAGPALGDLTVHSNTMWLPPTLATGTGSNTKTYLLVWDSDTGKVYPIDAGTVAFVPTV